MTPVCSVEVEETTILIKTLLGTAYPSICPTSSKLLDARKRS